MFDSGQMEKSSLENARCLTQLAHYTSQMQITRLALSLKTGPHMKHLWNYDSLVLRKTHSHIRFGLKASRHLLPVNSP